MWYVMWLQTKCIKQIKISYECALYTLTLSNELHRR